MKRFLIIAVFALVASMGSASAQKVAVKTNALYWATATPNVGMELALADRWTFELEGGYNPWTLNTDNNIKVKHWLLSPEVRYWFCESFLGHFIGINGNYAQFNVAGHRLPPVFINLSSDSPDTDLAKSRIEGWAAGAGLTYGYAFPIARRWNLELTGGFGIWYSQYDQFESRKCGLFQQTYARHLIGPTKCGLSFIYLFK